MIKKLEYAQNAAMERLAGMDVGGMNARELADYFSTLMVAESMVTTHKNFMRLDGLYQIFNKEA